MSCDFQKAGDIVSRARFRSDLSPKEVHKRAGINPAHLAYIERGDLAPKPHLALRLCDVLELSETERGSCLSTWGLFGEGSPLDFPHLDAEAYALGCGAHAVVL